MVVGGIDAPVQRVQTTYCTCILKIDQFICMKFAQRILIIDL